MSNDGKIIGAIGALTIAILLIIGLSGNRNGNAQSSSSTTADPSVLIRSDSPSEGPSGAKVTIVEFADFQCPACAEVNPTINAIESAYKNQVRLVYRYFPLPQHTNAVPAAIAAEAANEQGKFWEMHDLLFKNQTDWENSSNPNEIFTSYARQLGLDETKFAAALKDSSVKAKIDEGVKDGNTLGVNATPTLYVNGQKYNGAVTQAALKQAIDADLAQK